jgi:hypothetical protein
MGGKADFAAHALLGPVAMAFHPDNPLRLIIFGSIAVYTSDRRLAMKVYEAVITQGLLHGVAGGIMPGGGKMVRWQNISAKVDYGE